MKSEYEIEFEQSIKSLDMEFQIFQNPKSSSKLTQNRLAQFQGSLKALKKVYDRMEEKFKANMRNKNYNEFDLKNKLKKHNQNLQKIRDRFHQLSQKLTHQSQLDALFTNRSPTSQSQNKTDMQKNQDNLTRINNINKDAQQTLGVYEGINEQLEQHNKRLDEIDRDAGDFEHQLGLSQQLMRVIQNRELLTKLMLVLLVFFLGLADFLILLVKI